MSGQSWIRRSSPSSSKNGPLKATLPMSSLTRQTSNLRQHSQDNSPNTLSPTSPWKTRASPDQILSGIRSPGALNYKGKCHLPSHSSASIRRTASLDTIYLTGQWPRDFHASLLHLDKATQTEELDGKKSQRYTPDFSVMTEDKLDKMIRHRLLQRQSSCSRDNILLPHPPRPTMQEHSSQTGGGGGGTPPPLLPLPIRHSRPPPPQQPPVAASASTSTSMRSSTERLNQEIERLVLRAMSSLGGSDGEEEKAIQITPEGHRAPPPDLLRLTTTTTTTRTVNTQTPSSDQPPVVSPRPPRDTPGGDTSSPASLSSSLGDETAGAATVSPTQLLSPTGRQLMSRDDLMMSPRFVALSLSLSPKAGASSDESPDMEEVVGGLGGGGGGGGGGGNRSPKINRFLAREPPDGCERVSLKFTEDNSSKDLTLTDYSDFKPSVTFQLKPSAGSAFLPLSTAPPTTTKTPPSDSPPTTTATANLSET